MKLSIIRVNLAENSAVFAHKRALFSVSYVCVGNLILKKKTTLVELISFWASQKA